MATVESGRWAGMRPERVDVPATYCLAGGVWTRLEEGVRGLAVRDRSGAAAAYMLCEPATRYHRVTTRSERMPAPIGEVIQHLTRGGAAVVTETETEVKDKAAADVIEAREAEARRFPRESADCAAAEWAGVRYAFDEHRRRGVARLRSRREDDEPHEPGERRPAPSGSRAASVGELFRRHPAWGGGVVCVPHPSLAGCYLLGRVPEAW